MSAFFLTRLSHLRATFLQCKMELYGKDCEKERQWYAKILLIYHITCYNQMFSAFGRYILKFTCFLAVLAF